jgi:NAD(P)-dependent dehydrogenase (short-subunit alcohol dehydrogenase family)
MTAYARPDALDGKVAIVTGAARGIGRGITRALTDRGAAVVLVDFAEEPLVAAVKELEAAGKKVTSRLVDIREAGVHDGIAQAAVDEFGHLDILVNNAIATRAAAPLVEHSDDDYDVVFDTGPRATFRLMKAAYPHLLAAGGGSVVNFGSSAGTEGQAGWATYAAAKEAIRGFTKVAANEWGEHNIRVNVLCPFANSEGAQMWEQVDPTGYNAMLSRVPLRRIGDTRDDIGAMVSFLSSDEATYITGQTIMIDGGTGGYR